MLVVSSKSNLGCEGVAVCVFMVGSFSDHSRIVPALEMTFHLFSANFCQMLSGHFAWQAQYLVSLDGDIGCSAHCKWGFICHEDELCVSLFVVGGVLGEGQVSLFVAGAVLGEVQVLLFVVGAVPWASQNDEWLQSRYWFWSFKNHYLRMIFGTTSIKIKSTLLKSRIQEIKSISNQ